MKVKWCTHCEQHKGLDEFYPNRTRGGYQSRCKHCNKHLATKWKRDNPERAKALDRAERHRNRDRYAARSNAYKRRKNAESGGRYWAERRARRRAARLNRTPGWACAATIRKIYLERPDGHHVDHIIPLRGELVSGLHVPENLQCLPGIENIRKSAKYQPQWDILRPELLSW